MIQNSDNLQGANEKLKNDILSAALYAKRIKTFLDECIPLISEALQARDAVFFEYNSLDQCATGQKSGCSFLLKLMKTSRLYALLQRGAAFECAANGDYKQLAEAFVFHMQRIAVLPVLDGTQLRGFFLFASHEQKGFALDCAQRLNVLSQPLTEAILRVKWVQELIYSEAKYKGGFECSITSMSITTLNEGIFVDANENFCDLFQYSQNEMIGKSVADLQIWSDPKERLKLREQLRIQGYANNFETVMRRKDGQLHTCIINATIYELEDQTVILSSIIDITARKQAETALYESQQLHQTVMDGVDGCLAVRNADGRFVFVNPGYANILGKTPEEMIGKKTADFFSGEIAEQYKIEDKRILETGNSEIFEEFVVNSKGETKCFLMRKNPIYLGAERSLNICVFAMDITKQKIMEQALDVSNERYRKLFDIMLNGFSLNEIICDETGEPVNYRFLDVNPAFERMTGLSAKDVIGKTVLEVLPETELSLIKAFGKVGLTGEEMCFENYTEEFDKYFSMLAFCPQKGQCAVLSTDITEKKRMEYALYAEKERLEITLTSIGDGVITTDSNGCIELLNASAEEMTGWKNEEAKGKDLGEVFDIYNEITGRRAVNPIERVLKSGKMVELANHTALKSKQGISRSIADSAAPIKDPKGNVLGAVLVFRDVTTEKRRNERIAYLSYHDMLTDLYNRNYLDEKLAVLNESFEHPVAVIMGDVNGLKLTNDIFGHKEGDHLLKVIANILRKNCRQDDILVRWAGDEFLMVMPNTNVKNAEEICENILNECEAFDHIGERIVTPPSISLGFAVKEDPQSDIVQAIKAAEDFMYKRKLLESRSAHSAIITSLKKSLFEKSNETEEHAVRMAELCFKIGLIMELPADTLNDLHLFALLHDIGKIAVNDSILNKPGKLNPKEWEEMKRHPEIGYRIAQCTTEFRSISEYILTHHERWDGTGYTQGLKGEQIPLSSRILSVVDAFDAMTTKRPYREALPIEQVKAEFIRCSGTQFDPNIVSIFLEKVLPDII